MVKIYFVRHCEAEGNKAKIFQGTTDCDISETGAKQLELLKERFKDIHIDKVYSSPLIRAYKTAQAAVVGKGIEVITDKDFMEIHGGIIEGMTFERIFSEYAEIERIWVEETQNFAVLGGESMRQVYERAKKAIHKIAEDPENADKTLLVASHGAVTKCLLCYLLYDDIEQLVNVPWANNTAVSLITYDEKGFEVVYYNDDSHIPEELMPAASRIVTKLREKED